MDIAVKMKIKLDFSIKVCIIKTMKRKFKCKARGQSTQWCDGCKVFMQGSGKCPFRDKYRDLRNTKKGKNYYGLL